MSTIKKHVIGGLTAYYLKQGRNWWVESEHGKERFKSIEEMVERYPVLMEVEAIKKSIDRRQFFTTEGKPASTPEDQLITSETKCYYCEGTGVAGALPCPNCNGEGLVRVSSRLS